MQKKGKHRLHGDAFLLQERRRLHLVPSLFFIRAQIQVFLCPGHCHIKQPALLFLCRIRFCLLIRADPVHAVDQEHLFPFQALGTVHGGKGHAFPVLLGFFHGMVIAHNVRSPVLPGFPFLCVFLIPVPDVQKLRHIRLHILGIFFQVVPVRSQQGQDL